MLFADVVLQAGGAVIALATELARVAPCARVDKAMLCEVALPCKFFTALLTFPLLDAMMLREMTTQVARLTGAVGTVLAMKRLFARMCAQMLEIVAFRHKLFRTIFARIVSSAVVHVEVNAQV